MEEDHEYLVKVTGSHWHSIKCYNDDGSDHDISKVSSVLGTITCIFVFLLLLRGTNDKESAVISGFFCISK